MNQGKTWDEWKEVLMCNRANLNVLIPLRAGDANRWL